VSAPCDVDKRREITFHPLPPGQVERALDLLDALPKLKVRQMGDLVVEVAYCINDHSLQDLENLLDQHAFHLENSLLIRVRRALVHYCEHVQRDNLHSPEVQTKLFKASIEAWDKNPHGDHDETPAEWRQYK
jgi:hypothetical protein